MNNSNYQAYNSGITQFTKVKIFLIFKMIEDNQKQLIKAYELQNLENYEESLICLEKIANNFHLLGRVADQYAYTPQVIQDNRELLSQAHVDSIYDKFPKIEINKNTNLKKHKKLKQHKVKWSDNEQKLFLEGIKEFGMKSKKITHNNLKFF